MLDPFDVVPLAVAAPVGPMLAGEPLASQLLPRVGHDVLRGGLVVVEQQVDVGVLVGVTGRGGADEEDRAGTAVREVGVGGTPRIRPQTIGRRRHRRRSSVAGAPGAPRPRRLRESPATPAATW